MSVGGRFSGITEADSHRAEEKKGLHLGDLIEIPSGKKETDHDIGGHFRVKSPDDFANAKFPEGLAQGAEFWFFNRQVLETHGLPRSWVRARA